MGRSWIFLLINLIVFGGLLSLAALLFGSGFTASLFIGATFSLLMMPPLLVCAIAKIDILPTAIAGALWICAILFVPALGSNFSYTAGEEALYSNGSPSIWLISSLVPTVSILLFIASAMTKNIFRTKETSE